MAAPIFKIIFSLTKLDSDDFDRDYVRRSLDIVPSSSCPPRKGKGMAKCNYSERIKDALRGLTILPADDGRYEVVINASWSFEISKIESYDVEYALGFVKKIILGKEQTVIKLCKDYNLFAEVIVHLYAEADDMPVLELSAPTISFLYSLNATLRFDLHID